MIFYTTVGTNFLHEAVQFYDHLLGLVGAQRVMEFDRGFAWGTRPGEPMFCLMQPFDGNPASIGNGVMIALRVESQEVVDQMHELALALGGADEGPPGERSDGFYAAYFRDLDGNKLCAVCADAASVVTEQESIH